MKIVIALGGNALGNNPEEQKELLKIPAQKVASLVAMGHTVLIGHGNGPQVGMIYNAFADAKKSNEKTPSVPFAEAGGMSQGYIGYHMLAAIKTELNKLNLAKEVVYVETLTYVDKNDEAFNNPTKPVGPFYSTREEAERFNPNSTIIDDAGRGFRVVVPSPKPKDILGVNTIKALVNAGVVVIAGGGGGIPTVKNGDTVYGVDGVIDKDFTCAKIAEKIDADLFVILTAVDNVYVNWNKPDQKKLETVSINELDTYIQEGQFAKGSMLPKIEACVKFVNSGENKKAIIADLKNAELAIEGNSGTIIVK